MVLEKLGQESSSTSEQEYQALLRSLRWTDGFGMLFVQCSPSQGDRIITQVQADLPKKVIETLTLTEAIDDLYGLVEALPNKDQIDILFIQGVEHSLYDYEKTFLWDKPQDRYIKGVPRLLGHLNLSRERFRDHFNIYFVFLIPKFALKYFARRAPDFFDWRSAVLEFPSEMDLLEQASFSLVQPEDNNEYLKWTQADRDRKIIELQCWIEEPA
jgi:hypothetical protein